VHGRGAREGGSGATPSPEPLTPVNGSASVRASCAAQRSAAQRSAAQRSAAQRLLRCAACLRCASRALGPARRPAAALLVGPQLDPGCISGCLAALEAGKFDKVRRQQLLSGP
jgi:hypothetical protein